MRNTRPAAGRLQADGVPWTQTEDDDGKTPRQRLMRAATELFCRYGINGVGVDTVVEKAGTAKTTLYKLFGSKDRLVEAVLEEEGRAWRDWFITRLEAGEATPAQRLRRIFPLLAEWFGSDHFYGCPLINAVGEHDKQDDRLRELAMAHKRLVLGPIIALAEEAGLADPARFASQIGLLIDGAIVIAMITRDASAATLGGGVLDELMAAKQARPTSVTYA